MSGKRLNDEIVRTLSVRGRTVLDPEANLTVPSLTVSGQLDIGLRPHNIASDTLTVPHYFGQQLSFPPGYDSLRIKLTALNDKGGTLDFTGIPPVNTLQFWINFYTANGGTLVRPGTMSTAFYSESFEAKVTPAETEVLQGNTITYDVCAEGLFYNQPAEAKYWSIYMRAVDHNFGTSNFDNKLPIETFFATPYFAPPP